MNKLAKQADLSLSRCYNQHLHSFETLILHLLGFYFSCINRWNNSAFLKSHFYLQLFLKKER